jgi:pseudouridine-5'-phosphate glycosidase/pseudouridine kinase
MPYPQNLQVAKELENVVRAGGAVPATIAVIHGVPRIGLSEEHLTLLAKNQHEVKKASTRDLAYVCAKGLHAATTVASTMKLASLANIHVFATGGVGGVHRGAETTMDISADLIELSRTPVTVVCAGIKSILDIPKSLEVLETQGVPVMGYQTESFPAFFTNNSGYFAPGIIRHPKEVAQMIVNNEEMKISSGIVVAVPNPQPADETMINDAISEALQEAEKNGIKGAAITPFLLGKIERITGGKSLEANIALVKNNTKIATEIACHYVALSKSNPKNASFSSHNKVFEVQSTPTQQNQSGDVSEPSKIPFNTNKQQILSPPRQNSDAVVIGGAVMDIIGRVTASLTRQHTSNPGSLQTSHGGVGRNIADSLARNGTSVLLATSVGYDDSGKSLIQHANQLQMDTSHVLVKSSDIDENGKVIQEWSTASYCAIHDQNGNLNLGLADMSIFNAIDGVYVETLKDQIAKCKIVVTDGNISVSAFSKIAELCDELNKPIFFEPTSDFKCLLPFQSNAFNRVSILKPNTTELIQMISHALHNDMIRSGKATVSSILANIVSNRIMEVDPDQLDLVDIRVLVTALYRVLCSGSGGGNPGVVKKGAVSGKHILVSLGKRGVLWCGPTYCLSAEEKSRLTKSNQLVISGSDNSMTCYVPTESIDKSLLKDTNGAGDNFCAGVVQSIIDQNNRSEQSGTLNSGILVPNLYCIEKGLQRSREWLLRFSSQ